MGKFAFSFVKDLFADGFRIVGLLGPTLSAIFWIGKLGFGKTLMLQDWSYAWGFLPLTVWLAVAYFKRWSATSSNLNAKIVQYSQGTEGARGELVALINVTVKNLGPPTILENWRVSIILPDGRHVTAILEQIRSTTLEIGSGTINLNARDAIYDKASSIPIPQGSKVGGWLQARFASLTADDRSLDNSIELMFNDVFGKQHVVIERGTQQIENFSYIPDGTGGFGVGG